MQKLDIDMVESFRNLTKSITNFFEEKLLKDSAISCSELSIIKSIHDNSLKERKVNVTEIASDLHMSKSAVSQLIAKLEKKGLVKRKLNLLDKKINYIVVSKKAITIYDKTKEDAKEIILSVVNKMGEKDSIELCKLLDKLSAVINDEGEDA
jgi:DNA-binding MarR family transcriptional regulator